MALLPEKELTAAFGLARSTLRVRRARGRLRRRGSIALPTHDKGERAHARVDVDEAIASAGTTRLVFKRHELYAIQDPRGRIRRVTKAQREAYAAEHGCGCAMCTPLTPAELAANEAEDRAWRLRSGIPTPALEEPEDSDDAPVRTRERVL